jgi:uncharacterized protein (TIGR03435 family)
MRSILGIALIIAVLVPGTIITAVQNQPLKFSVASIKPDKWGPGEIMGGGCRGTDTKMSGAFPVAPPPLGGCRMTRMTLRMLVQSAYLRNGMFDLDADQLVQGVPKWIDSDRFTIEARAEGPPPTEAQLKEMLQNLLADRFKVSLHRATKGDIPAYALVVAKDGPKFSEAIGNEEHPGISGGFGSGSFVGTRASISMLATMLSGKLDRPVEDKTNLKATYNFTLKWTPGDNETSIASKLNLPAEIRDKLAKPDLNGPSIFTALQEQLGLRLESEKIGREIFVIDHAEKPSEN